MHIQLKKERTCFRKVNNRKEKKKINIFLSICLHNIISCGTSVEPLNYAKDTTTCVHVKI